SLLNDQKKKTGAFKKLIGKNEPWRTDGDPSTPILASYIGEPLKLHLIQGAQEEQHIFSITGMKWKAEPESPNSGYMNGQQIGISEHFEFDTPVPSKGTNVTDYWYGSPAVENMWDGMWGLIRSYGFTEKTATTQREAYQLKPLIRLPNISPPPFVAGGFTCPNVGEISESHKPKFFVGAWLASDLLNNLRGLQYNKRFDIDDPNAIVFVEQDFKWFENNLEPEKILHELQLRYANGKKKIEPLILRAHAGDCLTVKFVNYLPNMSNRDGLNVPSSWSYNLMPPIVNGFNFNQVQASSSVILQPQLVQQSLKTGFPTVGFNSCNVPAKTPYVDQNTGKLIACELQSSSFESCRDSLSPNFNKCEATSLEWYVGDVTFSSTPFVESPFKNAKIVTKLISADVSEADYAQADALDVQIANTGWARFTPIEFGAVALRDFGDVIKHPSHGVIGMLIVEPKNATWKLIDQDSLTGKKLPEEKVSATKAIVTPENAEPFYEFAVLMQDDLSLHQHKQAMPNHRMADDAEDTGQKAFNYRSEPLWARNGVGTSGADFNELNQVDYSNTLSSLKNIAPCSRDNKPCPDFDPETPVFEAPAGVKVRFRVAHPSGHSRQHAFVLYGHNWDYQPWINNSTKQWDGEDKPTDNNKPLTARLGASGGIGPGRHLNILTKAGGKCSVPGDYLFRVQEQFQFQGGMWGIFRVNSSKEKSKC
ncbi:MAG: hypothetical protein HOO93_09745, partial [Methyloglobulus sp.]|nr:hypothetical protein [Methyloglobulus sp.]